MLFAIFLWFGEKPFPQVETIGSNVEHRLTVAILVSLTASGGDVKTPLSR